MPLIAQFDLPELMTTMLKNNAQNLETYGNFLHYAHIVHNATLVENILKLLSDKLEQKPLVLSETELRVKLLFLEELKKFLQMRSQNLSIRKVIFEAMREYQDGRSTLLIQPQLKDYRIFENLGDDFYFKNRDWSSALYFFNKSSSFFTPYSLSSLLQNNLSETLFEEEQNRYLSLIYKSAVSLYQQGKTNQSIDLLLSLLYSPDLGVSNSVKNTFNLFSLLSVLFYQQKNYYASEGYLLTLANRLLKVKNEIEEIDIQNSPSHFFLLNNLSRVLNNLGVVQMLLYAENKEQKYFSLALNHLRQAHSFYNMLSRDSASYIRDQGLDFFPQNSVSSASLIAQDFSFLNLRLLLKENGDLASPNDFFFFFQVPLTLETEFSHLSF